MANDIKLVKMHCTETNKYFCLELNDDNKVVNMVELEEKDANKVVTTVNITNNLMTAPNLLPCKKCGSRIVAGCTCPKESNKKCKKEMPYNFQCTYCNKLEIIKKNTSLPKIIVTSPYYDCIEKVLEKMNLKYSKYNEKIDCDIFFINCGTKDKIYPKELEQFVRNGGCVYISDLAYTYLESTFPGYIEFDADGSTGKVMAKVEDSELFNIIGHNIFIEFDLPSWAIIKSVKKDVNVILRASSTSNYPNAPLMVSFHYGKGLVFYTSFHNHNQASEKETMLLQLLLLKQIGSTYGQSIEQIGDLIGLNIVTMKNKFRS